MDDIADHDRMEKETNALQKDAKTYLDAMRGKSYSFFMRSSSYVKHDTKLICIAMASSQTRIAETISLFYTADRASDVSLRSTHTIQAAKVGMLIEYRELWLDTLIKLR